MSEENAVVVAVNDGFVLVEARRQDVCHACVASAGCGTAVLQRVLGRRRNQLSVRCDLPVSPGDQVVLRLDDDALIRASVTLYGLPLAGLFGGALLASFLQEATTLVTAEWPVMLGAAIGLVAGFITLRRFTLRVAQDGRYQAVIVPQAGNTGAVPLVLIKRHFNK